MLNNSGRPWVESVISVKENCISKKVGSNIKRVIIQNSEKILKMQGY